MSSSFVRRLRHAAFALVLPLAASGAEAQTPSPRWVAGGDYHNWYSPYGAECEACFAETMQFGARWPGIYEFTDAQVSKGLWIGAQNVPDESGGAPYAVRVVHAGPRVRGDGEMFPTRFEVTTRFPLPAVTVDGAASVPGPTESRLVADGVDPSQEADVVLTSTFNTLLGLTVTRRVLQFGISGHGDYHVIEYEVENTGNTDGDDEIERPGQTLSGVTLFLLSRLAVARETRYVVANSTGWGKNAMNDARGDGTEADPEGERFRAQFTWHGLSPESQLDYDNLGGSIQAPAVNVAPSDTLGRLGASQFVGVVTLHADASAADEADDPAQPSTTTWISSDAAILSNNDASNRVGMGQEYGLMTGGHRSPRHSRAVEPSGLPGFLAPTADPSLGTSGGYSFGNGYGPYTLAPGESVRVVVAEGAGGLSREANAAIGAAFKASGNDAGAGLTYGGETKTKNEWVFTGRDSLFQTFRRAIANYDAGYDVPRPPDPPASLDVSGSAGGVRVTWAPPARREGLAGFEVYRAQGRHDSTYVRVHAAGPEATDFEDADVRLGVPYFYHVVSVGRAEDNDGRGMTPRGALRSSRYHTQTYSPVQARPVASEAGPEAARLRLDPPAPHPVSGAVTFRVRLADPAELTLTVHSVVGREVARVAEGRRLAAGEHGLAWDASGVASGVYLVRATAGGETQALRVVVAR